MNYKAHGLSSLQYFLEGGGSIILDASEVLRFGVV